MTRKPQIMEVDIEGKVIVPVTLPALYFKRKNVHIGFSKLDDNMCNCCHSKKN